jgi:protein SCO1/2
MKSFSLAATLVLCWGLVGCHDKPAESPEVVTAPLSNSPAASTNVQSFLVRGVVKKVDRADQSVTIRHEKIANYMPAMTMPFKIKDTNELEHAEAGDTIWFRLWVAADESWIDRIKKETKATEEPPQANAAPEREAVRVVPDVPVLKVGDVMPDYRFTNELGRVVHLSDFKGQALAFTFIFTRCPLPDFCPRMSKNFSEVCQKLKALPNGPTNWHLLTISFDPHFDTPSVLRGYAQSFQSDPERWNFVTGAMVDIDAITDQLELVVVKRGNDWDHKMRTVVVDAAGHVQKIIYGNTWAPDALVEEIVKAARVALPATAESASDTKAGTVARSP